jgi:hypothetical protein
MKVPVMIAETTMKSGRYEKKSIIVTCSRCSKSAKVYGASKASILRGCAMLRERCAEDNFYVTGNTERF